MPPLLFSDDHDGGQQVCLDLAGLYDKAARARFEVRWEAFFASDPAHPHIFQKAGNLIRYRNLFFIPEVLDNRPPVLFLMGNPASHSTRAGVCFSYEGRQRRHRFWTTLAECGFLDFCDSAAQDTLEPPARHARMREQLLSASYISPFRIGITPIFSMPSTASAPPWSGVSGLLRLFGKRALCAIVEEEKKRVHRVVESFVNKGGVIIAFQKDAYESMRSAASPRYSLSAVKATQLVGRYSADPSITLLAGPPTRFWTGRAIREGLRNLKNDVERRLALSVEAPRQC